MNDIIYLDNNATTAVDKEVYEAMIPYLTERYGNPSSIHTFGGSVARDIRNARHQLAQLIGALESEIIFTSCGTEGDNMAIRGILSSQSKDKNHIITSRVEHPAVKNVCQYLNNIGYEITYIDVDTKGNMNIDELKNSIRKTTALITVMWANNETGVIFPVEEIAEIADYYEIPFHTDAVQAVGKIPIDMKTNKIDLLSLSGHKIHAPKGIGAIYIRKGTRIDPFIIGGHQEFNKRGGTENAASIIGLGKAARLAQENMSIENTNVKKLRDELEEFILKNVSDTLVNGDRDNRLPNTTNISFKYIEGEAILLYLDKFGICASSGSACTTGSLEPSHVLRAMGVPFDSIHGSVRFSLSRYTTSDEIRKVKDTIPNVIEILRKMSPFNKDNPVWK